MALLRSHFDFLPDAELGIEIDPRTVNDDTMALLAELGFNRTSFGVQRLIVEADLPSVEARLQPYEEAGLIKVDAQRIQVTPKGRMFVRAVGMVFDQYLGQPKISKFSRLI